MIGHKNSTLNPLASTFVPSGLLGAISTEIKQNEMVLTRNMASKLVHDLVESKKVNGEKFLTKQELVNIIEKLIYLRYNVNNPLDMQLIKNYLSLKIPLAVEFDNMTSDVHFEKKDYSKTEFQSFDPSAFRLPKPTVLLVAFWGLHRHEQALRPTMSLTCRPDVFKDEVWSIAPKDLTLWNSCSVEILCRCPTMFGYTIPPEFFGNPLNLAYSCTEKRIHLNRHPETPEGNEFIQEDIMRNYSADLVPFNDNFDENVKTEVNLDIYLKQLKSTVSSICHLISNVDEGVECIDPPSLDEDVSENYLDMFWDKDPSKLGRLKADEIVEDDNCHPLLDTDHSSVEEGVSYEIEEMIRKSLYLDDFCKVENLCANARDHSPTCDPPCSVWCHSSTKSCNNDSKAIRFLNDSTEFLLESTESCISSTDPLTPYEKSDDHTFQKRYFKRSFSANDCDRYYEERYGADPAVPQLVSSREALSFLRNDPINFFKTLRNRRDSWKDNDSGIVSYWSSQEDVFCDSGFEMKDTSATEHEERTPMWALFSGEDSLWTPLPDSAKQDQSNASLPHKRVRDIKRQRSLN